MEHGMEIMAWLRDEPTLSEIPRLFWEWDGEVKAHSRDWIWRMATRSQPAEQLDRLLDLVGHADPFIVAVLDSAGDCALFVFSAREWNMQVVRAEEGAIV